MHLGEQFSHFPYKIVICHCWLFSQALKMICNIYWTSCIWNIHFFSVNFILWMALLKQCKYKIWISFFWHSSKFAQSASKNELPHDKTSKMACAPTEGSDQPGHPPSLIRVFAVCMKKAWVLSYPLSGQRRLIRLGGCPGWLSLCWAHMLFCWFCHEVAQISHLMRKGTAAFCSLKSFKCPSPATQKGQRCYCHKLLLVPIIMRRNSEGSGESAWMLTWAFAVCLCDMYPFLMNWLQRSQ